MILTDEAGYSDWDSGVVRVEGLVGPSEGIRVFSKLKTMPIFAALDPALGGGLRVQAETWDRITTTAEEGIMEAEMTWTERLDEPRQVELRPVEAGRRNLIAGQIMLYPNGRAIDDLIRTIPKGEPRSQKQLREELATVHGADVTCPVTTRRCLHVVTEAAYEAAQKGMPLDDVTPMWRITDLSQPMLRKLSFDPDFLLDRRAQEGLPNR